MRRNTLCNILFSLLVFLTLTKNTLAVTTMLSDIPESINSESFTIKVTISGANTGTNYLKIDLYKPSTTNYFGETFNGLGWYSESDPIQYFSINVQSEADWSGEIQGKIGSPNANQYDGVGDYKLRVRRYTSSGNYSSTEANNSSVDININALPLIVSPTLTQQESPKPEVSNEQLISPTQSVTYANIYISEVMVEPESGDNEWLEIYNANNIEVILNNWYIDDTANSGSTPKQFSLTIQPQAYGSFELVSSIFNNDGDSVSLLDYNKKEVDSFQYESSVKGKTLGRINLNNDNFCVQNKTKNNLNSDCLILVPSATGKSNQVPTLTNIISRSSSITLSPTLTNPQTTTLKSRQLFPTQDTNLVSPVETKSEILGVQTETKTNQKNQNKSLITLLTSLSFSYSTLAIISLLFKIKIGL